MPSKSATHRSSDATTESDELVTALLSSSRALVGVSARSLAEVSEEVTLAQFRTLVVLSTAAKPLRLIEVAARLDVQASTAQRSVERLLARGLVDRQENPSNRREVQLRLTPAGRRIVSRVTATRRRAIAAIVDQMPAKRRRDLIAALTAFSDAAGESAASEAGELGW